MIELKLIIMVLCWFGMTAKFHPELYESTKIVAIEGGKIVGESFENFYAFRGIPYAEPPVGALRFAPPRPYLERWNGIRQYKNFSAICAQYDHFGYVYEGDEDCLTVNVYVPKLVAHSQRKFPVVFFIHGGAFMYGGGNVYGPELIMKEENMILVTVNYRLGVLGFLSTEDSVIPGNFGLKDQVEALSWIQRNIAAFNGDPTKVLVTGFSAGGASTHLHYMSTLTDGLFNNGISHSGNALDPWVMVENSKKKAHQVAAFVDCPQNHTEMLECLRSKPAEDLVMLAKKYQPFLYNPYSPFGVVVEPASDSAFLTDHPLNILKAGNYKKLPWLLSQTLDEGLYPASEFYDEAILKTINDQWDQLAPHLFDFNGTSSDEKQKLEISKRIRSFYMKDKIVEKKTFDMLLQAFTDRLFHNGAFKSLQLQSKYSPTFFYYFRMVTKTGEIPRNVTHDEKSSQFKQNLGVSHGDDVFLIYDNPDSRSYIPYSEGEKIVSKNLIGIYSSFSKQNVPFYGNLSISAVKPNKINGLEIYSDRKVFMAVKDEKFGQTKFWDSLNLNEN